MACFPREDSPNPPIRSDDFDPSRDKGLADFAALREDARPADIVDALEALAEERQRRRKERQQQAAVPQGPIAQDDVGWDF